MSSSLSIHNSPPTKKAASSLSTTSTQASSSNSSSSCSSRSSCHALAAASVQQLIFNNALDKERAATVTRQASIAAAGTPLVEAIKSIANTSSPETLCNIKGHVEGHFHRYSDQLQQQYVWEQQSSAAELSQILNK